MQAPFIPGIELARRYYAEEVRPALEAAEPGLVHSAALIGWGSDVLGYDSARSTDHNWGPRCQVFVGPGDADRIDEITSTLAARLPPTFLGWPTRFPDVTDAEDPVRLRHWVDVAELGGWLTGQLGFDPRAGVDLVDWLATPTQLLAELTAGAVFHDGLDSGLTAARRALRWYPDDIWRYLLACQWQRISQEEPFPGRCAEAGDELGSALITARLARDSIRLVMLAIPGNRRWPFRHRAGRIDSRRPDQASAADRCLRSVRRQHRRDGARDAAPGRGQGAGQQIARCWPAAGRSYAVTCDSTVQFYGHYRKRRPADHLPRFRKKALQSAVAAGRPWGGDDFVVSDLRGAVWCQSGEHGVLPVADRASRARRNRRDREAQVRWPGGQAAAQGRRRRCFPRR